MNWRTRHSEPLHARCPRCGYDQRGVIAAWRDLCPLHGTCSECGLHIIWAEALVPEKFEPQWCVEFEPRVGHVPIAAARTLVNSFWPRRFWSHLKMSQPIRWRRLAAYLFLLLLPLLAEYILAQGAMAARMRYLTHQQFAAYPGWLNLRVRYERMNLDALTAAKAIRSMNAPERTAALQNVPPGFNLAPDYQQFIEDLSQMPDELHDSMIASKQRTVNVLQAQASTPPKMLMSYAGAIFEGVFLPFAQSSSGRIQLGDGSLLPYPSPVEIHDQISSVRTGTLSWSDDLAMRLALTLAGVLGLLILMPVSFVLLPVSRRRAKVRWPHVLRIFIYSQFALLIVTLAMIGSCAWYLIAENEVALLMMRAVPPMAWIGITLWWASAIKRYLKLPHAGAVAWMLSLMLVLLLSPIVVQVMPDWMVNLVLIG